MLSNIRFGVRAPLRQSTALRMGLQHSSSSTSQRHVAVHAEQQQQQQAGHQVPNSSVVSEAAMDPEIVAYRNHQASAARISAADEARTLIALASFGVLATVGSDPEGYPTGSMVSFAADDSGRPVFSFSNLAAHTKDLKRDGRCSLTVTVANWKSMADSRVSLIGDVTRVPDDEVESAREVFKSRHPDAFWSDFGDFAWYRMDKVAAARLVAGFGRIAKVSAEDYAAAKSDPVAGFSAPIASHMNADHADSTVAMIKHYVGITVDSAEILTVDRLGMNVACTRQGQSFKCRLPFVTPADSRKGVKDSIVEMTRAAAAAASAASA